VLMPVASLLLAQLARSYARAGLLLLAGFAITVASLHDFDAQAHASRNDPSRTPQNIGPLIATLDRAHVRYAFADYWIAYRIDFDSDERIVAVENKFDELSVRHGTPLPGPDPFVRSGAYDEAVRRARSPGFVFFLRRMPKSRILATLAGHGYRRHDVQIFAVYTRA
jgi:hypothetical protein